MGDFIDKEHGVFIAEEHQLEAVKPEVKDLLAGYAGSYARTFTGTKQALETDGLTTDAFFVPALRFVVRASLGVLEHKEVSGQLPQEVEAREIIAGDITRQVVQIADERRVFGLAHWFSELPAFEHDDDNRSALEELSASIFKDVACLAGGALKLLRTLDKPTLNETYAIQKSLGLLRLARLTADDSPRVYAELGEPYVLTDNLQVEESRAGLKVDFKPEVLSRMRKGRLFEKGDGCPAAKMKAGDTPGSILLADWQTVVHYLVPPNATVYRYGEGDLAQHPYPSSPLLQ